MKTARFFWIGAFLGAVATGVHAQEHAADSSRSHLAVMEEVVANIRNQPIGRHTLEDFDLPDRFLRRVADRIIRSSYRERFHRVVRVTPARPGEDVDIRILPDLESDIMRERFKVRDTAIKPESLAYWRSLPEQRPPLRGFRAALDDPSDHHNPFFAPAIVDDTLSAPSAIVAKRLAKQGLIATLADVLETLGPARFVTCGKNQLQTLWQVGLPVDMLDFFVIQDRGLRCSGPLLVQAIARRMVRDGEAKSLQPFLRSARFEFAPASPGFRVATESGEHDIQMMRLQLTRGNYWKGPGAGGSVDIAAQLIRRLEDMTFLISIEQPFTDSFLTLAKQWDVRNQGRITLLTEPLNVAQWAQDNGKAGSISSPSDDRACMATLAPRYASRNEDGSVFVAGETSLLTSVAATGHTVIQSPLLFQGGNLIAVTDPKRSQRILFIGEAEIYRNTALGLTHDQAIEAFRAEFGVDRCVVLPAVSFHVDLDVSFRQSGDHVMAFVNDPPAAALAIVRSGVAALTAKSVITEEQGDRYLKLLRRHNDAEAVLAIGQAVGSQAIAPGTYPLPLADAFADGAVDSPVGNFQRFLAALDFLVATSHEPHQISTDPMMQSYLHAIRRKEIDREELKQALRGQRFKVVRIPSFSEANRSINYLNGIHDRHSFLMPAYGGFYASLDKLTEAAFREALGSKIKIIPILCGESQRRTGALHCSVASYPRP